MKWTEERPKLGSIIRVHFAKNLYHYGIYVSDSEIIQFGMNPQFYTDNKDCEILVCTTDMENFLYGGSLETEHPDEQETVLRKSAQQTVLAARNRIGEKGYDILHNNCEHFVFECAYNDWESVRRRVRKEKKE